MHNYAILRKKLEQGEPVTIGYIGGSITMAGNDVPATGKSWRASTTRALMEKYPNCPITEINGGISGTGSDFGCFRAESQVLCRKPDLIFVEFTVNDGFGTRWARSMEGLIRRCRMECPRAAMMMLTMLNYSDDPKYWENGEEPPKKALHEKMARHYGIPVLENGKLLYEALKRGELVFETAMMDVVHPAAPGHKVYADEAVRVITEQMESETEGLDPLPEPMDPLCWERGRLLPAMLMRQEGFSMEYRHQWGYDLNLMVSDKVGARMEIPFTGRVLGLYWIVDRDAGQIRVTIDGGEPTVFTAWDETVIPYPNRLCYTILAEELPLADHRAVIEVIPKKEQSEGNFIRIEAAMVN